MSTAVGNILREAREERDLSLEQVAQGTFIRLHYLQAMEAGDFDSLPSKVQAKGFLRAYASYLGMDASTLLNLLARGEHTVTEIPDPVTPESDKPDPAPDDPAARFIEIGRALTAQREQLGLSLDDVERHTHLRVRYLQALESGNLTGLPSSVQGRGMLKNYAEFLGLNPDPLLLTFADGLQAGLTERRPETLPSVEPQAQQAATPPRRRLLSRDLFIGLFLVVFLVAFGVLGGMQIASLQAAADEVIPTPPSIAEVLLPSPTTTLEPTLTATVLAAIDEEAILTPVPGNADDGAEIVGTPVSLLGPVRIQIVVRERAFLRVTVDGDIAFNGRVLPGSVYTFAGEENVEILTGSGSAVQLVHNEQDIGVLGTYGQVVTFVITVDGIQTPTPTVTLTPTPTPTEEVTPTPNP